jgi:ABC-type Fe3+ transport system substrate-binding protein
MMRRGHGSPSSFPMWLAGVCVVMVLVAVGRSAFADDMKSVNELKVFPAQTSPASTLTIHGTANLYAMGPVIDDFQAANPEVEVRYRLYETTPLYQEAVAALATSPDLLVSSAMDLQAKLANDGYAQPHTSAAVQRLPDWAVWRDEVFGFTLEPAVIVYNNDAFAPGEAPRTHRDLTRLLERSPEKFRGKVATYDIGASGVGYLFATTESTLSANFWRLTRAFGVVKARLFCCTEDMLESVARGESLVAYNVLGSYALRSRAASLRIVLPEDYVVAVARTMVIPRHASNPALAKRFIDHVLSERGQAAVAQAFGLAVIGNTREQMRANYEVDAPGVMHPLALGLNLLGYLDQIKRDQFLRTWHQIVSR